MGRHNTAGRASRLLTDRAALLEDAQAALAAPTLVTDGAEIDLTWGDYRLEEGVVRIWASAGSSLTNITLWEWDGTRWYAIHVIAGPVVVNSTSGYRFEAPKVDGSRLALSATIAGGGGNVSASYTPREVVTG